MTTFIGVTHNAIRFSDGTFLQLSDRFVAECRRGPFTGDRWVLDGYGYDPAEPVAVVFVMRLGMAKEHVLEQVGRMMDAMNRAVEAE